MRIFVSYARVDKPYCMQIVDVLSVHEIWYDQRLYAGQHWWKEILRRLDWCEGFMYLLSPESVTSEYCRREFELALDLGKHIFPILIQPNTPVPSKLSEYQYIDLIDGLSIDNVTSLLNSIYAAERLGNRRPDDTVDEHTNGAVAKPPMVDETKMVGLAAEAMEKGQFDRAVFLLRQAKERGYHSRFIKIDEFLAEAETALERQSYLREAARDYNQIIELIKHKSTRHLGCEAFAAFAEVYPNYDPNGIQDVCNRIQQSHNHESRQLPSVFVPKAPPVPLLDWCEIPAGTIKPGGPQSEETPVHVAQFCLSKYPITNLQYQCFIDAPDGYRNAEWWRFSAAAFAWRQQNETPRPPGFTADERPREMVNWYDAVAFCHWLSANLGFEVRLPWLAERQRAIQGDDHRVYPWGNTFDKRFCNTRESGIRQTTLVTRYPQGVNQYGVFDLAGNVWEWCQDLRYDEANDDTDPSTEKYAVHGGSFVSPFTRCQASFHYYLPASTYYGSIGFRIVYAN